MIIIIIIFVQIRQFKSSNWNSEGYNWILIHVEKPSRHLAQNYMN